MSDDAHEDYLYALMRGRAGIDGLGQTVEQPPRVIDLGHDVRIMLTHRSVGDGPSAPVGFIESHPTPEGRGCSGQVVFDVPAAEGLSGPRWTLHSLEPLHVEPSVLCRGCGHHGWVRNGAWVPA